MLCAEWLLVKRHADGDEICPLPCRSWECDHCAPKRKALLLKMAEAGNPNRLLTLTVSPAVGSSPTHRRQLLHDAWKKLVKRILRHFKWSSLPYMAFVERTQRGEPHLHILLRCGFLPQAWLSAQMGELLNSPIVDIRLVRNAAQAVRYVAKYVAKAPARFGSFKRYWRSRSWCKTDERGDWAPRHPRGEYSADRRRWRDLLQERTVARWTWEAYEDGWFRFWRPGVNPGRHGLIRTFDTS